MERFEFGRLVKSKAGHDKGSIYVVVKEDTGIVWLADGDVRKLDSPKKKNKKHVQIINKDYPEIMEAHTKGILRDENIKRILKDYKSSRKSETE